jgi:protein gp37
MAQATAIEWTDVSWNPVHGCSKVSPGCANCYAETLSRRYGQTAHAWTPEHAAENVLLKPHKLREPLSGAKAWRGLGTAAAAAGKTDGKLVFVNSMSDLFHELVPFDYIDLVFATMAQAGQHTFQVLTKRPERMREYVLSREGLRTEPLPNVWLGTSIENRRFVGRADVLGDIPAAVRFLSCEPLLGPLIAESMTSGMDGQSWTWQDGYAGPMLRFYNDDGVLSFHWLIAGGESGPGHRRVDAEWVRDLRDVCVHEGVAFFFKQWGGATPKAGGRELDGRTWDEMP